MRPLLTALFLSLSLTLSQAAVVRLAPDFAVTGTTKVHSLKGFRGQPVVVIIAPSAKSKDFKKQAKYLEEIYQQFASKQVIFIAALADTAEPIKSSVPFVVASNGAAVAGAYNIQGKYGIAIIGKDGNLDYVTDHVLIPERVRDVVQNSYEVQANTGR